MPANPSIRYWKTSQPQPGYPDWWPCWRSPDVFVDNDGDAAESWDGSFKYYQNVDEAGEPVKGGTQPNKLFAVIRNLGTDPASDVLVKFSYAPFGVVSGVLYRHEHFKEIGQCKADLAAAGQADAERIIEMEWDLSNLTENNEGLWPAPVAFFDHFCVRVDITSPGDASPADNGTQHNFVNIISMSPASPIYLLAANYEKKEIEAEITAEALQEGTGLRLRGVDRVNEQFSEPMWEHFEVMGERKRIHRLDPRKRVSVGNLLMRPKENRLLVLTAANFEKEGRRFVELSFKVKGKDVGGVSFGIRRKTQGARLMPGRMHVHVPRFIAKSAVTSRPVKSLLKGGRV